MGSLVDRFGPGDVTIEADEVEQPTDDLPAPGPSWAAAYQAEVDRLAHSELAALVVEEIPAGPSSDRLPFNAVTGAAYRGQNIMRLALAEAQGEYGPGGWAGFKQWLSVGRVVRKGEHGTACITVIGKMRDEGEATTASTGKRGVRGFRVFHFDQTVELIEE